MFEGSENKDLANAFVHFMLQKANLNKFAEAVGFLPGTVEACRPRAFLDDPLRAVRRADARPLRRTRRRRAGARSRARTSSTAMQNVMKGKQTAAGGRARSSPEKMDEEFAASERACRPAVAGGACAPRGPAAAQRLCARRLDAAAARAPAPAGGDDHRRRSSRTRWPRRSGMSFTDTRLRRPHHGASTWVGLDNYKAVFTDAHLRHVARQHRRLRHGVRGRDDGCWAAPSRCCSTSTFRGNGFFGARRAAALGGARRWPRASIFKWMFNDRYGFVNWALSSLGFTTSRTTPGSPIATAPTSPIFVVVVWQSFPFIALSLLAGLQTLPQDTLDAAARRRRRRRRSASASSRSRCCARSSPCW